MALRSKVVAIQCNGLTLPRAAVREASAALKAGEIIATPTDTIYGIAALVQNPRAVQRLYEIKGRDPKKPVAISVAEIDDIYNWGHVTVDRQVLQELLPGPVTVVFERTADLNPDLNPDTNLIGIRIPDHSFIRDVCRACAGPIALTSANISSAKSSLAVDEFQELFPKLCKVFDGGRLGDTEEARFVRLIHVLTC